MGVGRVLLWCLPPPQEGLAKVLGVCLGGGVQFCLLYRPRNPFLKYFLSIFLNFFCDKIKMVFFLGWKMNPRSKPLSVQHSSGQKLILVCKVSAGNWIRGQNPDRFSTVPVKKGSPYSGTGRKPDPASLNNKGSGRKWIPVSGTGRKTDPGSLNYKGSGRKWIPVFGYRPKTRSGVSELQRFQPETESEVKTSICSAQFRSKIDSGRQGSGRKLNPGSIIINNQYQE